MMSTEFPASEKQITFINQLLDSRQVPTNDPVLKAFTVDRFSALSTVSKRSASAVISALLGLPKLATPAAASLQEVLARVPKAKYAIPTDEIDIAPLTGTPLTGDLLFIEVREYEKTLYMRRLTGAPGSFNRDKVPHADVLIIIDLIAKDPYKYTRLFGENYACCGKCGAELTDPTSRSLFLGPECRKAFGY
jgi:hypothetical protein